MSKNVTKKMSGRTYETKVVTMIRQGITKEVEDYEREGICEGEPRNNIEWHKSKGWEIVE